MGVIPPHRSSGSHSAARQNMAPKPIPKPVPKILKLILKIVTRPRTAPLLTRTVGVIIKKIQNKEFDSKLQIVKADSTSRTPHINAHTKLISGKSVKDAINTPYNDDNTNERKYSRTDLSWQILWSPQTRFSSLRFFFHKSGGV